MVKFKGLLKNEFIGLGAIGGGIVGFIIQNTVFFSDESVLAFVLTFPNLLAFALSTFWLRHPEWTQSMALFFYVVIGSVIGFIISKVKK